MNFGSVDAYTGVGNAWVVGFGKDAGEGESWTGIFLDGIGDSDGIGNAMLVSVIGGIQFTFGIVDCGLVQALGAAAGFIFSFFAE